MTPAVTLHALCDAINRRVDALAEATREHERIELRVSIHADVALLRSIAVSNARASEAAVHEGFCRGCSDFKETHGQLCADCTPVETRADTLSDLGLRRGPEGQLVDS
jgi:predicted transcriptional regulator